MENSYKEVKSFYWKHILHGAVSRNLPVDITPKQAYELLESQGWRCALTGWPIAIAKSNAEHRGGSTTASLDRINSNFGYTAENIQWVHKKVNRSKQKLTNDEFTDMAKAISFHSFHKNGRPSWDQYYLTIAELVAVRSLDPDTKHGCVIVDGNNRVLSIGYNGPISAIDDTQVPLNRPDKYYWMSHAEQNAIMFCNGQMQNSTVYLTGRPCSTCVRMLIQKGASRIVHSGKPSSCIDEKDLEHSDHMLKLSGVTLEEVALKIGGINA